MMQLMTLRGAKFKRTECAAPEHDDLAGVVGSCHDVGVRTPPGQLPSGGGPGTLFVRANHWSSFSVTHFETCHVKLAPFNRDI